MRRALSATGTPQNRRISDSCGNNCTPFAHSMPWDAASSCCNMLRSCPPDGFYRSPSSCTFGYISAWRSLFRLLVPERPRRRRGPARKPPPQRRRALSPCLARWYRSRDPLPGRRRREDLLHLSSLTTQLLLSFRLPPCRTQYSFVSFRARTMICTCSTTHLPGISS